MAYGDAVALAPAGRMPLPCPPWGRVNGALRTSRQRGNGGVPPPPPPFPECHTGASPLDPSPLVSLSKTPQAHGHTRDCWRLSNHLNWELGYAVIPNSPPPPPPSEAPKAPAPDPRATDAPARVRLARRLHRWAEWLLERPAAAAPRPSAGGARALEVLEAFESVRPITNFEVRRVPHARSLLEAAAQSGHKRTIQFVIEAYRRRHLWAVVWQYEIAPGLWQAYPEAHQTHIREHFEGAEPGDTLELRGTDHFSATLDFRRRQHVFGAAERHRRPLRGQLRPLLYEEGPGGWRASRRPTQPLRDAGCCVALAPGTVALAAAFATATGGDWGAAAGETEGDAVLALLIREGAVDPSRWAPPCAPGPGAEAGPGEGPGAGGAAPGQPRRTALGSLVRALWPRRPRPRPVPGPAAPAPPVALPKAGGRPLCVAPWQLARGLDWVLVEALRGSEEDRKAERGAFPPALADAPAAAGPTSRLTDGLDRPGKAPYDFYDHAPSAVPKQCLQFCLDLPRFAVSAPRDALEGKGPQRRPPKRSDGRLGRRLEEVAKAVGGRLLSVTNAIEAGTWRQRDSGWA